MITFSKKGFTLIELIVVMAVLLFVVGTAIVIFISIVQHQRVILAQQDLLNQTSYVLERMSKALRTAKKDSTGICLVDNFGTKYVGYNYLLTRPVGGFYTGIKFINQSDNSVCEEFYLDNSVAGSPILKEIKNGGTPIALTSDKLIVNSARFSVDGQNGSTSGSIGAPGDDKVQPRVTIFLDIQTKGDINQSIKKIQTTISQRDLNVQQ